ncbi:MAG: DUF6427 family protein [Polaribacter sp.]|nr:DUF6427 family protein [Polaribacter sp.]
MLANFFGKSKPVNFLLISILFILYVVLFIVVYRFESIHIGVWLQILGGFFVFLALFFLYNFIVSKNKLTEDSSYAFLFFVISLGFFPNIISDFKIVIVNLTLLLFLRKVYSLRSSKAVLEKLVDGGLWLGVSFILEPFTIVYILVIFAAIILFIKVKIQTVLIPFLGFGTPVFLYYTYCFYTDQMGLFTSLFEFSTVYDFSVYDTPFYQLTFGLFGFFVLLSIIARSSKIFSVSNQLKRSWVLLLLHLIVAIVFVGLLTTHSGAEVIAISIPATIIIANWVQFVKRKILVDIILVLFLVLSFAIHFIV